jgi:hypothetical protein
MSSLLVYNLVWVGLGIAIGLAILRERVRSTGAIKRVRWWSDGLTGAVLLAGFAVFIVRFDFFHFPPTKEWGVFAAMALGLLAGNIGPGRMRWQRETPAARRAYLVGYLGFVQYIACTAASDILGLRESPVYLSYLVISRLILVGSLAISAIFLVYSSIIKHRTHVPGSLLNHT